MNTHEYYIHVHVYNYYNLWHGIHTYYAYQFAYNLCHITQILSNNEYALININDDVDGGGGDFNDEDEACDDGSDSIDIDL